MAGERRRDRCRVGGEILVPDLERPLRCPRRRDVAPPHPGRATRVARRFELSAAFGLDPEARIRPVRHAGVVGLRLLASQPRLLEERAHDVAAVANDVHDARSRDRRAERPGRRRPSPASARRDGRHRRGRRVARRRGSAGAGRLPARARARRARERQPSRAPPRRGRRTLEAIRSRLRGRSFPSAASPRRTRAGRRGDRSARRRTPRAEGPAAWPRGAGSPSTRGRRARARFSQRRSSSVDTIRRSRRECGHVTRAPSGRRHRLRRLLVGGVAVVALVAASMALAARGYSDAAGDSNSAPDITSVEVGETTPGVLAIRLSIGNYASLPARSWVNLWFDLDSDQETGAAGDEALVRYSADGGVELYAWDGSQLVAGSTDGVTASFAAGVLTVSLPRASIAAEASFGMLVVSSRAQSLGEDELVASDYAPDAGRSAYAGPATDGISRPCRRSRCRPGCHLRPRQRREERLDHVRDHHPELRDAPVRVRDRADRRRRLEPGDRRRWSRAVDHARRRRGRPRQVERPALGSGHAAHAGSRAQQPQRRRHRPARAGARQRASLRFLAPERRSQHGGRRRRRRGLRPERLLVLGVCAREPSCAHPGRDGTGRHAATSTGRTVLHGEPPGDEIRHGTSRSPPGTSTAACAPRAWRCGRRAVSRGARRRVRSSCRARRRARSCAGRSPSASTARSSPGTSRSPCSSNALRASFSPPPHLVKWGKTPVAGGDSCHGGSRSPLAKLGLRQRRVGSRRVSSGIAASCAGGGAVRGMELQPAGERPRLPVPTPKSNVLRAEVMEPLDQP